MLPLQWRHNERHDISNYQPHDCLLNRLFSHRSKKTSKFRVTGLCAGNSPVNDEFSQRASNEENVSIWWRHHAPLNSECSRACDETTNRLIWLNSSSEDQTRNHNKTSTRPRTKYWKRNVILRIFSQLRAPELWHWYTYTSLLKSFLTCHWYILGTTKVR